VDRADERERIEVLLAPAQAPVQARGGRAAGMAGLEVAEDGAARDRLPRGHHRIDRLVGAAQAVGVVDRDQHGVRLEVVDGVAEVAHDLCDHAVGVGHRDLRPIDKM